MTTLKVSDLLIHPMNEYYFDDMSGEKWDSFLNSVKTNGVRTPIIVTDDMRVVSGNQRVRACRELGISVINAEIEHYQTENDVIRDLIEINIRQRGAIDDSEIKMGRRIAFLQEYYGIEHGGNRKAKPNNSVLKSQSDLANELGMSVDTLQNYAKLTEMIPEMQELVDTGVVTKTVALSVVKKLTAEEQKQLVEQIGGIEKVTGREVEFYTKRIKTLSDENNELRNRKQEVRTVEKIVEVVPDDYEELKQSREASKKEYANLRKEYDRMADKWKEAENQKDALLKTMNAPEEKRKTDLKNECFFFCSGVKNFLEKYGGYIYLKDELDLLPTREQKAYMDSIRAIRNWVETMLGEITIGG